MKDRRPLIEVSEEKNSGFGFEILITSRWSHFAFWTRRRAVDIYTGDVAEDYRKDLEIEMDWERTLERKQE